MNAETLKRLLNRVAQGDMPVEQAFKKMSQPPVEDIGYAHIDHHRSIRKGFPEVIFGQGKTADQIIGIIKRMLSREHVILATRVGPQKAKAICRAFDTATYHPDARMVVLHSQPVPRQGIGMILVISAGTSDIPVAREAVVTAEAMGNAVESLFDVGVAGLHRLFAHMDLICRAHVLVVVAGMEGALPSVVAGLVSRPVIAVPSSVGYGAGFGGLTALFAMLNSCSSNVTVVNIDNGFGAGYMASIINRP